MSDTRTPGAAGQGTDPSSPLEVSAILEELRELRGDVEQCFDDIHGAIGGVEMRLRALEMMFRGTHASGVPGAVAKLPPAMALRSDGAVLLSIAHVDAGVDLSAREHWIGVVLTGSEVDDARARISEACDEAAGLVGGGRLRESVKPEADPDPGGAS